MRKTILLKILLKFNYTFSLKICFPYDIYVKKKEIKVNF